MSLSNQHLVSPDTHAQVAEIAVAANEHRNRKEILKSGPTRTRTNSRDILVENMKYWDFLMHY